MGGEKEENDEEGAEEENINEENKNEESVNESEKKNEEAQQPTNNAHLIKQIGPITIDSTPPEKPTRHRDVAESMRGSVLSRCPIVDCIFLTKPLLRPGMSQWHLMGGWGWGGSGSPLSMYTTRPGSPISWNFGVKESITVAPPRPESASLLV